MVDHLFLAEIEDNAIKAIPDERGELPLFALDEFIVEHDLLGEDELFEPL